MECEHNFQILDTCHVCVKCGLEKPFPLLSTEQAFTDVPLKFERTYSRVDRFLRSIQNLRGLQFIPCEIMETIPRKKTVAELRKWLKKNNRKLLPKIASVWYQLGNRFRPIVPREIEEAKSWFLAVREKCSFLLLVPWVLEKIGRQDLLVFVKPPSTAILNKYKKFLPEKRGQFT